MVYSLGIPKQTETAKAKYSILDCLKENMDAGYAFLMFRTQNWEESIRVILLISVYCFLTTTDRVATPLSFTLNSSIWAQSWCWGSWATQLVWFHRFLWSGLQYLFVLIFTWSLGCFEKLLKNKRVGGGKAPRTCIHFTCLKNSNFHTQFVHLWGISKQYSEMFYKQNHEKKNLSSSFKTPNTVSGFYHLTLENKRIPNTRRCCEEVWWVSQCPLRSLCHHRENS